LVLRWTIDQPGITIALAGARNAAQALENAKAAQIKISQEEMDYINGQIKQMDLVSIA
jgi:aryl-alcohol dehydrogenase-like predicted oxidoreductase